MPKEKCFYCKGSGERKAHRHTYRCTACEGAKEVHPIVADLREGVYAALQGWAEGDDQRMIDKAIERLEVLEDLFDLAMEVLPEATSPRHADVVIKHMSKWPVDAQERMLSAIEAKKPVPKKDTASSTPTGGGDQGDAKT